MPKNLFLLILMLAMLPLGGTVVAEETADENPGPLDELTWMVGGWRGVALGGVCEEVWTSAGGGQMIGTFRLIGEEGVGFYEFMTIDHADEGFRLRLKHFNPDLTGWEKKDEVMEFGEGKTEDGKVTFKGISYSQIPGDSLLVVLEDKRSDGTHERIEFRMGRFDPLQ